MSNHQTLPCIVCKGQLENATPFPDNQPSHGVCCSARGNYGSTVYDPIGEDEQYLEFNVCDSCLVEANNQGRVNLVRVERTTSVTAGKWQR